MPSSAMVESTACRALGMIGARNITIMPNAQSTSSGATRYRSWRGGNIYLDFTVTATRPEFAAFAPPAGRMSASYACCGRFHHFQNVLRGGFDPARKKRASRFPIHSIIAAIRNKMPRSRRSRSGSKLFLSWVTPPKNTRW